MIKRIINQVDYHYRHQIIIIIVAVAIIAIIVISNRERALWDVTNHETIFK